jgi:iron-sulfur cluster assembly protein
MKEPVTFSERAIEEAKKMMIEQNVFGAYGLRVAVGGGGCGSGGAVEPILGFDKQKETDMVYEIAGVTILIDKKHMLHLAGKHVEFYEVEGLSGFHFVDTPSG